MPRGSSDPPVGGRRRERQELWSQLTPELLRHYLEVVDELKDGRLLLLDNGQVIRTTEDSARYAPDVEEFIAVLLRNNLARALRSDTEVVLEDWLVIAQPLRLTARGADVIARLAVKLLS